MKPETNILL